MRITRPRATKLSQITIDSELDMGAHNIVLGAGQTVDGVDVSVLLDVLTVAFLKTLTATGTATAPANINDNDTGTTTTFDAVNEYIEIDFGTPLRISQYRVWSYD